MYYLVYDDHCALCLKSAEKIKMLDNKRELTLIGLNSENFSDKLSIFKNDNMNKEIHLFHENRLIATGGDAVIEIVSILTNSRLLYIICSFPGIMPIVRLFYRLVAKYR